MGIDDTQITVRPDETEDYRKLQLLLQLYDGQLPQKWEIADGIKVVGFHERRNGFFPAVVTAVDHKAKTCDLMEILKDDNQRNVQIFSTTVPFRELLEWNQGLQLPRTSQVIKSNIKKRVTKLRRLLPNVFKTL